MGQASSAGQPENRGYCHVCRRVTLFELTRPLRVYGGDAIGEPAYCIGETRNGGAWYCTVCNVLYHNVPPVPGAPPADHAFD